jgi:hypothetical protein
MTKKFMTDLQHFEAMSRLKEHLHRVGEDGFAYDPEWSDKRVAEETGATLTNIRGLRLRVYGALVAPPLPELVDPRIDELVEKHNSLVRWVAELNPGKPVDDMLIEEAR